MLDVKHRWCFDFDKWRFYIYISGTTDKSQDDSLSASADHVPTTAHIIRVNVTIEIDLANTTSKCASTQISTYVLTYHISTAVTRMPLGGSSGAPYYSIMRAGSACAMWGATFFRMYSPRHLIPSIIVWATISYDSCSVKRAVHVQNIVQTVLLPFFFILILRIDPKQGHKVTMTQGYYWEWKNPGKHYWGENKIK